MATVGRSTTPRGAYSVARRAGSILFDSRRRSGNAMFTHFDTHTRRLGHHDLTGVEMCGGGRLVRASEHTASVEVEHRHRNCPSPPLESARLRGLASRSGEGRLLLGLPLGLRQRLCRRQLGDGSVTVSATGS